MSDKTKALVTDLALGLVVAVWVIVMNWEEDYTVVRRLCDGIFVAAVMLLGIGGIKFTRNKGAFDVAGYGMKSALLTALPFLKTQFGDTADEQFLEYRERKTEKRKSASAELWAGLVYLILALILCAVFMATQE